MCPQTLPTIIGKGAPKIETPHPSKPTMRRSRADLEEKRELLGRHLPTPRQTREKKRNEVRLLLTNDAIEKRTSPASAHHENLLANAGLDCPCQQTLIDATGRTNRYDLRAGYALAPLILN